MNSIRPGALRVAVHRVRTRYRELLRAERAAEDDGLEIIGVFHSHTHTEPYVKWALLYGVILCNARAMGEFGAVSVVSGHIRGQTNTLPLHVEILYNEYQGQAAFAVASLLALLAIATLVIKTAVQWRHEREMRAAAELPPERPAAADSKVFQPQSGVDTTSTAINKRAFS